MRAACAVLYADEALQHIREVHCAHTSVVVQLQLRQKYVFVNPLARIPPFFYLSWVVMRTGMERAKKADHLVVAVLQINVRDFANICGSPLVVTCMRNRKLIRATRKERKEGRFYLPRW